MSPRIERLRKTILPKTYPISIERARLITESYKETEGEPDVIRTEKARANLLNKMTLFIEDDELIVGNAASKPMGVEVSANAIWSKEAIEEMLKLRKEGWDIPENAAAELETLNAYWRPRNRTRKLIRVQDEDRLWPFTQTGWILPPMKSREQASRTGLAQSGLSFSLSPDYMSVPFSKVIGRGLNSFIEEAEKELKQVKFNSPGSLKKVYFLEATIIAHKAVISWANRFAALAEEMALKEEDAARKTELERIAETCRWVPANPPRTFYEAIQFFWFLFLLMSNGASGTTPLPRFDQFMYPYYQKDIKEGRTTDEEVLELLQCLRIKDMQIIGTSVSAHREKWSGLAKWHNMVIGGQTPDGKDATNELTYLILDAALKCPTPHHTITLRVHAGTPEDLMVKALEVVKSGLGMPAFVGDKSYIEYLVSKEVPLEVARDYHLIGCLDANVPEGCASLYPMCATTLAFNWLLHNGVDSKIDKQVGPRTGAFEDFKTFDELMDAFKAQVIHGMTLEAEMRNLRWQMGSDFTLFLDAFSSSLFSDGIKQGKSGFERELPYKLYNTMSPVGLVNMADSMAAIKKLVFDEKKISLKELKAALVANWQGERFEEIRKMCLAAPKFGNDDDYVDAIAGDLYQFYADSAARLEGPRGTKYNVAAISITAHQPAGALTGATPDGRYAGAILADGSVSPAQGWDMGGPTAVIRSASKIDQTPFQSTLLNMKFHPSSLNTEEDMRKLSSLIKTYFDLGGKHMQFNVIGKQKLVEAQAKPEQHRDLVVRVAGYSAYFVQLTQGIQNEIIGRMEHTVA